MLTTCLVGVARMAVALFGKWGIFILVPLPSVIVILRDVISCHTIVENSSTYAAVSDSEHEGDFCVAFQIRVHDPANGSSFAVYSAI